MTKKFLKHLKKDSGSLANFLWGLTKNPKVIIPAAIFIVFVVFNIFLNIANANKIIYGIKIGNEKIGGISSEQAKELLKRKTEKLENDIKLKINDKIIYATLNDLGVSIDINQTVKNISDIGKRGDFLKKSLVQFNAFIVPKNARFELKIDYPKFESFIDNNLSQFENPAINAALILNAEKNGFLLKSSSNGVVINKKKLLDDVQNRINTFKNNEIIISFKNDSPKVADDKIYFAKEKAEKIIALMPVILKYENKEWLINKEEIADILFFQPEFYENEWRLGVFLNEKLILNFIATIAPVINQEPVNAILTQKNGKIAEFALSQNGLNLDSEKNLKIISENILSAEESNKEINLIVDVIEPKISTKNIENMGITARLAVGESDFSGSPKSRIHNLTIGAEKFNGIFIKPDEEFSFNAFLGEVDEKSGYKAELVIKKDRTVPEYGGGLCQVSTTMFRAAMLTGLPILERSPHAYPVKYYNPQGFDATIYPPSPDLKFKNDTLSNILVQTKIKGTKLYFEFYGTDDGRKVKIIGPTTIEKNTDGSMKTILTREIYDKDGKLIKNSSFKSNYKSPDLYPIYRNPLE